MSKFRLLVLVWLGVLLPLCVLSQDIDLGMEYLKAGEYQKAKDVFQKFAKKKEQAEVIHKAYLQALVQLKDFAEAEKFLKRELKWFENTPLYWVDYGRILEIQRKEAEAQKQYAKAIDLAKINEELTNTLLDDFIGQNQLDLAIRLVEQYRAYAKNNSKFNMQMAKLYRMVGKPQEMIEEYLVFGKAIGDREVLEATLQDEVKTEEESALLEKLLYAKIQQFPDDPYYTELLIWHLIQKKEFYRAFVQARALDKRYKQEGGQVAELAFMAFQNKDFVAAGKMFEYLIKEYPKHQSYPLYRRYLINAKEEVVKNTYPINPSDIRILIAEYDKMLQDLGINERTLEAMRSKALLYAFYLNQKDSAIVILERVVKLSTNKPDIVDKCKLDLGDIYLLKGEPWESTLLYAQVEKSQKESPLGYDAKLRNAKLAYYRGEFDLAKEVLDILKQATTREIANDALNLSLLIQDNTGLDSTEKAMQAYAHVELLLFQRQNAEAIAKLEEMLSLYKGHPLEDEVLLLLASVYKKEGNVEKMLISLQKIVDKYPQDILADDAIFQLAQAYEALQKPEQAMQYYQQLLTQYTGSIYVAEARKRYRILRGDNIK